MTSLRRPRLAFELFEKLLTMERTKLTVGDNGMRCP